MLSAQSGAAPAAPPAAVAAASAIPDALFPLFIVQQITMFADKVQLE